VMLRSIAAMPTSDSIGQARTYLRGRDRCTARCPGRELALRGSRPLSGSAGGRCAVCPALASRCIGVACTRAAMVG
jgi:hypothetical protein